MDIFPHEIIIKILESANSNFIISYALTCKINIEIIISKLEYFSYNHNLPICESLFDLVKFSRMSPHQLLVYSCGVADRRMIKYLIEKGVLLDTEILNAAIESKNIELCKYLHFIGCPSNASSLHLACRIGAIELVKFFTEEIKIYSRFSLLPYVAKSGNVELMNYVVNSYNPTNDQISTAIFCAAREGTLEMYKFLQPRSKLSTIPEVFTEALKSGNIEVIMYMVDDLKVEVTFTSLITIAKYHGCGDISKYLLSKY